MPFLDESEGAFQYINERIDFNQLICLPIIDVFVLLVLPYLSPVRPSQKSPGMKVAAVVKD